MIVSARRCTTASTDPRCTRGAIYYENTAGRGEVTLNLAAWIGQPNLGRASFWWGVEPARTRPPRGRHVDVDSSSSDLGSADRHPAGLPYNAHRRARPIYEAGCRSRPHRCRRQRRSGDRRPPTSDLRWLVNSRRDHQGRERGGPAWARRRAAGRRRSPEAVWPRWRAGSALDVPDPAARGRVVLPKRASATLARRAGVRSPRRMVRERSSTSDEPPRRRMPSRSRRRHRLSPPNPRCVMPAARWRGMAAGVRRASRPCMSSQRSNTASGGRTPRLERCGTGHCASGGWWLVPSFHCVLRDPWPSLPNRHDAPATRRSSAVFRNWSVACRGQPSAYSHSARCRTPSPAYRQRAWCGRLQEQPLSPSAQRYPAPHRVRRGRFPRRDGSRERELATALPDPELT